MDRPFKVVMTDHTYPSLEIEEGIIRGANADFYAGNCRTEEEVIALARDADGIINQAFPITRRIIESLERCRVISRHGVGVDNVDLMAATEKNILVCNVPGYCTEEVSNHAIGLMLALTRKIHVACEGVRRGVWDFSAVGPLFDASTQTVGIIGFGRIGRAFARRAKVLGYRCAAYDPYVPAEVFEENGVEPLPLDDLLRRADIVSIHAPLTERTYRMIGEEELKKMKSTAILINTGRGRIIDQSALYLALREGGIAGAGLDVLEDEPPDPDDPLLKLENVVVTPHMGFYSESALVRLRIMAAESVVKVLRGETPPTAVNPEALQMALPL